MIGLAGLKQELIFPGSLASYSSATLSRLYPDCSLVTLSVGKATTRMVVSGVTPPQPAVRYILFFYGNGVNLAQCRDFLDYFRAFPATEVAIPDYVGYGLESFRPSEKGCYATALASYKYLTEDLAIPASRIILAGWSLGGAVALDLAYRLPAAGLLTLSAFTSLEDVAKLVIPRIPRFAYRLLLTDRFANLKKINRVSCPHLLAHGVRDELIPFWMAEKLYQQVSSTKPTASLLPLPSVTHNDIFEAGGKSLHQAIETFLSQF